MRWVCEGSWCQAGTEGRGESAVKPMALSPGLSLPRAPGFLLHHHCGLSFRDPPPKLRKLQGACQTWLCHDKGGATAGVGARIK